MFKLHDHWQIKGSPLFSATCRMALHWTDIFILLQELVIPGLFMRNGSEYLMFGLVENPIHCLKILLKWSTETTTFNVQKWASWTQTYVLLRSVAHSHRASPWLMAPIWSPTSVISGQCFWWWHILSGPCFWWWHTPPFNPHFPLRENCSFISSEDAPNKMDVPSYV